jgi:hypothetical protein
MAYKKGPSKVLSFDGQHERANDLQVGAVAVVMAPGSNYQGYLLLENMECRLIFPFFFANKAMIWGCALQINNKQIKGKQIKVLL